AGGGFDVERRSDDPRVRRLVDAGPLSVARGEGSASQSVPGVCARGGAGAGRPRSVPPAVRSRHRAARGGLAPVRGGSVREDPEDETEEAPSEGYAWSFARQERELPPEEYRAHLHLLDEIDEEELETLDLTGA